MIRVGLTPSRRSSCGWRPETVPIARRRVALRLAAEEGRVHAEVGTGLPHVQSHERACAVGDVRTRVMTVISGSREQVVKAARMHFLDGRTQDDIARVLETSRSNVSRMLTAARSLGIVEIRIQDGLGRDVDLEQALCERFGLAHVRVAAFRAHGDVVTAVASLAAEWLDGALRDGQTLGVSWGAALRAVVAAVSVDARRHVKVVPLMGGFPAATSAVAGQELV